MKNKIIAQTFRNIKLVLTALALLLFVVYAASGIYAVRPEQTGVVKRFGHIVAVDVAPGIHYRLPWPIETVDRVTTREVRTLRQEFLNGDIVAMRDYESMLLTGDENLAALTLLVNYTISDPGLFLSTAPDPEAVLRRLAAAECVTRFAGIGIDDILTNARNRLQQAIMGALQKRSEELGLGISIVSAQISEIKPPDSVESAFKEVASAREDKQRLVQEATGDRNRRLPEARAEAERSLRDAEAEAQERIERAHGDANGFTAQWEEYRNARDITARRMYLETMETVLNAVGTKHLIDPASERRMEKP